MRSKSLRFVLCLFLMPLTLVLSMPGAAVAAPTETVDFHLDGQFVASADCRLGVAMTGSGSASAIAVGAGGWCLSHGQPPSPFCDPYQAGCTTITLAAKDGFGVECGSAGIETISDSGIYATTLNLGAASVPIGDCDPVELCLTASFALTGLNDFSESGCVSTSLDPLEEPEDPLLECVQMTAVAPVRVENPAVAHYDYAKYGNWVGKRHVMASAQMLADATATAVTVYFIHANGRSGNGIAISPGMTRSSQALKTIAVTRTVAPSSTAHVDEDWIVRSANAEGVIRTDIADDELVGAGIFAERPGVNAMMVPQRSLSGVYDYQNGLLGITDPSRCSWYWGEVVAITPDSFDVPIGPVLPPEVEPPPPEEPPVVVPPTADEPPADESSFWGAILALLKSIWAAIVSLGGKIAALAGKIVDGITGAMEGLFVPADGFMDNRLDRLSGEWDDTAPVKWADELSGLQAGAVSGCSGLPLNVTLPGGVEVSESIGGACSGTMASVASLVRGVLSAVIVIGGLMACVRAVGSGFGWNPTVGGGSGA